MATFRERFDRLVEALRAHPRIEVLASEIRPPASREAIARAEEAVGKELPESIRAFYRAHDGVFLLWGIKGKSYPGAPDPFGFPDYNEPPGCINLAPIEETMTKDWESSSHVNEVSDDHWEQLFGERPAEGIPVRAVVIDNFSRYNHADLILGPEPMVIVSTDHGADMEASDFMAFDTYLDCALSVFGANRYSYGFGIGWSRAPQKIDRWEPRRTLDEIVAELDKDDE